MSAGPIITELRLPSRLGFEKVAMNTAASVAQIMGFSDDRVNDLKTAVAEACINAIEHGNRMNELLRCGGNAFDGRRIARSKDQDRYGRTRRWLVLISTVRCWAKETREGWNVFIQAVVTKWNMSARRPAVTRAGDSSQCRGKE
jgi:hypothetical protein